MSDLIDLNSPDTKDLLSTTLASPLIPLPKDTACSSYNIRANDPRALVVAKRESLENNPFDMLLHETTEYIQKKDDPFEVTLAEAIKLNCEKHTSLRTGSVDLIEDCIRKRKTHKEKLNKTLDESLLIKSLNQSNSSLRTISNDNIAVDLNNSNTSNDVKKLDNAIPFINVQDVDLSILNQSVMNDTLFETDKESNKDQIKLNLQNELLESIERDKIVMEQIPISTTVLKVQKLKRSFSQGDTISGKNIQKLKNISLRELLQIGSDSTNNVLSPNSFDVLNQGFLKSYCSGSSVFSNLSNISSIPGQNSYFSITNSSLMLSNGTMNRSFLESCSSDKSDSLTDAKQLTTIMEKNNTCDTNNKLIDIDTFSLESNYNKQDCRISAWDTSSDSVFIEENKVNKSILQEAKHLAKTFEELALKTSSESSTDDLISNNPLWTSELVPAFDEESSVDNLIELPISPDGNNAKSKSVEVMEDNNSHANKKEEPGDRIQDKIKELETELIEPISIGKRLTAVTLLLKLKNLLKTENNDEANKLLENLEETLGVNCESNTELLTTYFNAPNNLEDSPQKSNDSLEVAENVGQNNMEHSHENNLSNDFVENMNFNVLNSNKYTSNPRYMKSINGESKCDNFETELETEKVKNKETEKFNTKTLYTENPTCNKENDNLLNGRLIIELLSNIGKLLSEQTNEKPTLDVLKNVGDVLNSASNNCNADKDRNSDNTYIGIEQTPRKSKLRFESKTHFSNSSKLANRLSLNLEAKKQPTKNNIRRSISVSETPPLNSDSLLVSASKSRSQLKEVTKRFPSDPSFVSSTVNKKIIINNHKNAQQKDAHAEPVATLDLSKEKASRMNAVKDKLKKKSGSEIVNKRGPMKAILPIGNMQKNAASKKMSTTVDTITPPNSHKFISSTPNSTNTELASKKSRSSKPVASSTPDAQNAKIQSQIFTCPKKRNFSCDISPVIIHVNVNNNGKAKSPRRNTKLPSPKWTTPKKRQTLESGIPKSQTPPVNKRLNSPFDVNRDERMHESPQRSLHKKSNSQKSSPIVLKINENIQRSPLRDSNKLTHKAKPTNLIFKIRRHSVDSNAMEKENNHI